MNASMNHPDPVEPVQPLTTERAGPDASTSLPDKSSSFSPTMILLPRRIRSVALGLYGALRTIDDLVDARDESAAAHVAAAEEWCQTLLPTTPETEVFAAIHESHGLEPRLVSDFCHAMRHDLRSNEMQTEAALDEYCANVAGAVGAMFAQVAGNRTDEAERLARKLGQAIQLTHILRDIDVDLADDRTYIPQDSIARFGSIDVGERDELMRYFIARADDWFDSGIAGIRLLPTGRRWVFASASLYRETLRQIERDGYGRLRTHSTISRLKTRQIIFKSVLLPIQ